MKTNKTLLILIILLLAGILSVLVYQTSQPKTTGEKIEDALDDAADDLGNAIEGLGENIQDAAK